MPASQGEALLRNLFAALICVSLLLAGCGGGGGGTLAGSSGGGQVSVPNVAADTQSAATSALTGVGLALGNITSQVSTTVASGLVISESPVAGTMVAAGTMVNLVLSSGGIAVPNVVGDTQAAAQSAITGAGLTVGTVTSQASNSVASGSVISENPAAGTGVVAGTAVALVVSSGAGGGTTAYNVANAIVDQGPIALIQSGTVATNIMYVKVTVCAPGSTSNCQTIDHIQVDTGSQGLRILSSVITNASLLNALPTIAASGGSLAECTQFVDGYSWGPMATADVHIGGSDTATSGESAPGIPIQIIGTTTYPVPAGCSNVGGTQEDTVPDFGANGIIGLGLFEEDCGTGCSQTADNGLYYSCTSSACTPTAVPVANQSLNPVFKLIANNGVTDNNGVVIVLPAVPATGAATVTGSLIFGIGTQTNNALSPSATVLTTDPFYGFVTTSFLGQTDTTSYLDSGSNAIYFDDNSIPACTQPDVQGFFCPGSGVVDMFSATITGVNQLAAGVNFTIGDAYTLFSNNESFAAFSNLGGSASSAGSSGAGTFAWGLPFYYGHSVYTAMENTNAGGTNGPYFAF